MAKHHFHDPASNRIFYVDPWARPYPEPGNGKRKKPRKANAWLGCYIVGHLRETYPREAMRAALSAGPP